MGILDREPGYVRRLAEYITSKEGCRLRMFTFDNEQEVSSHLENERLDILLVGQSMADDAMKADCTQRGAASEGSGQPLRI